MNNNIKEKEEEIIFKKRNINAIIPKKGSKFSAGYDLFSIEDKIIEPLDKAMISTGISVKLPHNSYGRVAPRSGLTWKKFIDVGAGVIDEDYTGESIIIYLIYHNILYIL